MSSIFPRTCLSPSGPAPAHPVPDVPPMRFSFDDCDGQVSPSIQSHNQSRTDLELVEDLLGRCWQEVGASELNPKMTDIVRLLEFKNKLRATAEAEQTFWALINRIRREELSDFGLVSVSETAPE